MYRLGLIPSVDPETMIREAVPFAECLGAAIGLDVETIVLENYDAVGENLRSGGLDMAFIGPAGYVIAKDQLRAPIEPIARGVLALNMSAWGHAIIVARADSKIHAVSDLRGKSFVFSDPISTSGYLLPQRVLKDCGLDPERDMTIHPYSGSLGISLQKVLDGEVHAAGIGDEIMDLAVDRGEFSRSEIRVIHQSPPIPGSLFVARQEKDPARMQILSEAVLSMRDIHFCKIGRIHSMEPALDLEYDIVRQMIAAPANNHEGIR